MKHYGNRADEVRIAYIGGGSTDWAWRLMNDLAANDKMNGTVALYDINYESAAKNALIGEKYNTAEGARSHWNYHTCTTLGEALTGADFVVISILPATFDEMESDVHTPEKYGIYQSVGDTTGPGGIVRAMRTVPMYEEFARSIKEYCPRAWVINYTNPMTVCVRTLYKTFPQVKAFGCCHEVFGTQWLLADIAQETLGIDGLKRQDIAINPVSVNHFTWLTKAYYKNIDLFPYYKEFCKKKAENLAGKPKAKAEQNFFASEEMVKIDLFNRFGYIAAAGDRHLAEFCPGNWYLSSPERVREMHFELTPVWWRKQNRKERIDHQKRLLNGEEKLEITGTDEEGVLQMNALLGLGDMVTNINIPNYGQIPNLPLGAVVETNALLRGDCVVPVFAGEIPKPIHPLVSRICAQQELIVQGTNQRDPSVIFAAFSNDPLVTCTLSDAKKLFIEMCDKTAPYLKSYNDWYKI